MLKITPAFKIAVLLSFVSFLFLSATPSDARINLVDTNVGFDQDFGGTEGILPPSPGPGGDLEVLLCTTYSSGANSFSSPLPEGWTLIEHSSCQGGPGSCILGIYTRPAGSGEIPVTCRWSQATNVFIAGTFTYRGADGQNPVIASECESSQSGVPTVPSVNTEPFSAVLQVILLGGTQENILLSQRIPEGGFFGSVASTPPADEFLLISAESSLFIEGGETGEIEIPISDVSWTGCAIALRGGASPIPTMSEWGLMAFAGIAGAVSLLVIRRRARTA